VCYVVEQAAHDSGKLSDATIVTVGCSKEEFDRHHRIRPLEKDMEIMLTQVNLPSKSILTSLPELVTKLSVCSSSIDCVLFELKMGDK